MSEVEGTKLYQQAASVVLRGNFNPPIFQPSWFGARSLLGAREAESASEVAITGDVAVFKADWLSLQVTSDRFVAATPDPGCFQALADLVVGTFSLLEHTPFDKMGLNHEAHYELSSTERWHAFGDHLVPKGPWKQMFDGRVGMRSVVIEARRPDCKAKLIRVKVEPSAPLEQEARHGVFFAINEHHEADGDGAARQLLEALKQGWSDSHRFARDIQQHLLHAEY